MSGMSKSPFSYRDVCDSCGRPLPGRDLKAEVEDKVARRLGISKNLLREVSHKTYGRSFVEERDARTVGMPRGAVGHVTRHMSAEIADQITRWQERWNTYFEWLAKKLEEEPVR